MDLRDTLQRASIWLNASTAEVVGLLSLLAGGLALTVFVVLVPRGLPVGSDAPAWPGGESVELATTVKATIHVAGAVVRPGLVTVPVDARVADAIDQAGGPTADADLGGLNLARMVSDGERIVVPRQGEVPDGEGAAAGAWRADGILDLNAATTSDLEELPGVGPVLAGRIVAWRDANGPFTEVGQLREVSGIGEKTFQSLVDLVTV